jgi:hypothetical protein
VKQKSQASAAFLGVWTVSKDVVGGCCFPGTISAVFVPLKLHLRCTWNSKNGGNDGCLTAAVANQSSVEIRGDAQNVLNEKYVQTRRTAAVLRPFEYVSSAVS